MRLLILSIMVFTGFAHAESLKEKFLSTTTLQEGRSQLVAGDENCMSGRVRILEIDEERGKQSLTLMMGSERLVQGIGLGKVKEEERGCAGSSEAAYGKGFVSWKRDMECNGNKMIFKVDVTISSKGFQYKTHGKPEACVYEYSAE